MALPLYMADLIAVSGSNKFTIEKWLQRLDLRSGIAPSEHGRRRAFTEQNAVEIAGLAAFTAAGIPAAEAVTYADMLGRQWREKRRPTRRWFIFIAGAPDAAKAVDALDEQALTGLDMTGLAPVICAIDLAALFARLEAHFSERS